MPQTQEELIVSLRGSFKPSKEKAVVLLSGGLDSTTALSIARHSYFDDNILALIVLYGQKHELEAEAAYKVAQHYGVRSTSLIIDLPKGESVLMNHSAEMPQMTYEELSTSEGVSPTYVPFRNGTMLSHAAAVALDFGASEIWAGMHSEDARGWAYPDCTPEFIGAMQNAIYVGTYHKVRLVVPFTYATKAEIVKRGLQEEAPYSLTYSCYEGKRVACGRCPTCIGRLEAFKANGVRDPIEYDFDQYRRP
jgi:7-cyano-7-deazaguanine synthase